MAEKRHRAEEESFANRLYSMKARELDERLVDLSIAEEKTRRELNKATKEYNQVQVCARAGWTHLDVQPLVSSVGRLVYVHMCCTCMYEGGR